ncbi:hypothetical protein BCU12_00420 [Vibrio sp. 10N.261.55.A7]|nr:hypothetical protein BCU12_00420 [Vibrio sp. 10N.261.55.A7]
MTFLVWLGGEGTLIEFNPMGRIHTNNVINKVCSLPDPKNEVQECSGGRLYSNQDRLQAVKNHAND